MLSLLNNCLDEIEINLDLEQKNKLLSFIDILMKWNKAYNLTSIKNPNDILIKHIMDSLVVSKYLEFESFIDVGSGPGLPGIPLAITNVDKNFTLLDSLGKRIIFQKQVKMNLNIKNINSIEMRVEDYIPTKKFDGVLSRAFTSLENMLTLCDHLINSRGFFYALKAKITKEELILPEKFKVVDIIKLKVPKLAETRHLIKIKKLMN